MNTNNSRLLELVTIKSSTTQTNKPPKHHYYWNSSRNIPNYIMKLKLMFKAL